MSREHNPIALLISKIQQKWIDEVGNDENIQLVRWLIKPDQKRLYKGFLKLESTSQGSLPCIPVVLLTPFEDKENHSKLLISDWIENFKKDKSIQEAIKNKTLELNWDVKRYENELKETKNPDLLLLEMLASFERALPNKEYPLVLSLYPNAIFNENAYQKWFINLTSYVLPKNVKIMFFDDVNERNYDALVSKHGAKAKSLSVPLDLDGAINKLANQGNPNDPEVQFRVCMLEMGKSVNKNNLTRLQHWGDKGLEATKKTGSKSAYATAHMVFAGYLFNFKDYESIDALLLKSMAIAKQGLLIGDKPCQPLIIQGYGLQATSQQLQKNIKPAVKLYCKQADKAIEYGLGSQALTAWWLAYNAISNKDKDVYENIVLKAYNYGSTLEKDLVKASCMNFIGADCFNIHDNNKATKKCEEIDAFMTDIGGENWRENVEAQRKNMEKRKFTVLNWF